MNKRNKYLSYSLILTLIISAFSFHYPAKKNRFVKLFNGDNWVGWYLKIRSGEVDMAKKVYSIENKTIHVFNDTFPDSIKLNTGENDTHGLMYTFKKYSKFILRFEYKWGNKIANNFDQFQYDAGCYYHVSDDKIWPTGLEYQVRYDHTKDKNHTGDFWASGTTIQWYAGDDGKAFLLPKNGGKPQAVRTGEHLASPTTNYHTLNNKWNKCEVIVMADQYAIHKLNGDIVNMAVDLGASEGVIGFQSETAEIFYRNIKIKEFDEIIPIEDFL